MSLHKRRACDLLPGDRISLPMQLVPIDARVVESRNYPNSKGKYHTLITLETDTGPWQGAKAQFSFFGDERLDWYKPPGSIRRFFSLLNAWFNPFTFFAQ